LASKTVVLDPGHGGKDSGAIGNGIYEKDIVLKIAQGTKKYLEDNFEGVAVLMTRTKDEFIELLDRSKKANSWKASLFVSIHINASVNKAALGFETFIFEKSTSANTKKLQDLIHASIMKHAPYFKDRGQNKANFSVLRNTVMSAVLTEIGFITNSTDASQLKDNAKINNIAKGHGEGIASFLGLKRKAATPKSVYKVVVGSYEDIKEAQAIQNSLEKEFRNVTIITEKA
jgi:N-acetylmuramoyl-L-alanine amidase